MELWKQYQAWKTSCKWVDLSWELSPDVPHMDMFPALQVEKIMDIATDGANVFKYDVVGQYATHVDAPCHFSAGGKTLDQFSAQDLVMPLCVIDRSDAVRKDPDYALSKEDLLAWESEHGSIPKGAFVAFRSDWSKRGSIDAIMNNKDASGQKHTPGWDVDALKFLVEERNIAAIGHETGDTDPSIIGEASWYPAESYFLGQNRFQIELMRNLDQCPAMGALIFCTFPIATGGSGFTARCFALCEK